jgi:hypothetical protein
VDLDLPNQARVHAGTALSSNTEKLKFWVPDLVGWFPEIFHEKSQNAWSAKNRHAAPKKCQKNPQKADNKLLWLNCHDDGK